MFTPEYSSILFVVFTKDPKMITKVYYLFRRKFIQKSKLLMVFITLFTILFYFKYRNHNVPDLNSQDLPINMNKLNISMLVNQIRTFNEKETIQNLESFGKITEKTIIIVILVDKFSNNFKILLTSLSQIYGMDEVFLIFSHSYFDENLNSMIRSIEFCRVLQIYYPYSIQTHQNEFPGYSQSDCRNNRKFRSKCTGSTQDMRGRFREPSRSENKHHWWWAANTVFSDLSSTQDHKGLVIFMEGNFILSEDFIYMASFMKTIADSPPSVEFLTFGDAKIPSEMDLADFYSLREYFWTPTETGVIAFDIRAWDSIVGHYDVFCTFDDASWQRSLYFISVTRRDGIRYKTLSTFIPRVYKLGKSTPSFLSALFDSEDTNDILRFSSLVNSSVGNLFPVYLELYTEVVFDDDDDVIFDYSEGDGGWADRRDWELCLNITSSKIKRVILEMKKHYEE